MAAMAMPGPLDARTGGYIYNRRMVEGLRQLGWEAAVLELDASFPHPTANALEKANQAFSSLAQDTVTIVDSLALGAMPEIVAQAASRLPIVALVHLPLAAATGLDRMEVVRFEDGERRALAAVARVIVTGRAALPLISHYAVPDDRVVVVEPGTDRPPARNESATCVTAAGTRRPLELLTVATVGPGKGHETLLNALSCITNPPWQLTCAGSLTRHPATAARVRAEATRLGLADRVAFAGELDREALHECYARADVAVLATEQETYGMAIAEAVAHGLPVVATMTGAIPELVGDEAGMLVKIRDTAALRDALVRVLGDAALRARLAAGARARRKRLPTWEDAARAMASALAPLRGVHTHG